MAEAPIDPDVELRELLTLDSDDEARIAMLIQLTMLRRITEQNPDESTTISYVESQ